MWLEPIAKRSPQHARGRVRRTAFHDEMFSVKKIRGVPGIKRKWLEPGKRSKGRARPFPTISCNVGNAEIAGAVRKRSYRDGIPALQIEISVARRGWLRSPGIRPRRTIA